MKCLLTSWERPGGSAADYEAAQKLLLGIFERWHACYPDEFAVGRAGGVAKR